MKRSLSTRLGIATVAALAALSFAACSSGDDDATDATDASAETTDDDATATTTESTESSATTEVTEGTETTEASTETSASESSVTSTPAAGSSGGTGVVASQEEYIAAATEELRVEDNPELARCAAEAIVNDDVYAAIQEAGMDLEAFHDAAFVGNGVLIEQEVADAVASDIAACGNLTSSFSADDKEQNCLEASFDNVLIAEYLVAGLFGLTPSDEVLAADEAVTACMAG